MIQSTSPSLQVITNSSHNYSSFMILSENLYNNYQKKMIVNNSHPTHTHLFIFVMVVESITCMRMVALIAK